MKVSQNKKDWRLGDCKMWTEKYGIMIPHFLIVLREIAITPQSVTDLNENTGISYNHLHRLKGVFLDRGWVTAHKEEKKIILTVTAKGKDIVLTTQTLLNQLGIGVKDIMRHLQNMRTSKNKGKTNESSEDLQFVH